MGNQPELETLRGHDRLPSLDLTPRPSSSRLTRAVKSSTPPMAISRNTTWIVDRSNTRGPIWQARPFTCWLGDLNERFRMASVFDNRL